MFTESMIRYADDIDIISKSKDKIVEDEFEAIQDFIYLRSSISTIKREVNRYMWAKLNYQDKAVRRNTKLNI